MNFNIGKDILPHEYKGTIYNRDSAKRLGIVRIFFTVMFCCFIVRTLQLGLQSSEYKRADFYGADIERRADIIDRNGIVLAKSVESGNIKLYPPRVKEKYIDDVARVIHEIAPMDYSVADALALIRSGKSGVYIKKQATEDQIKYVKDINLK